MNGAATLSCETRERIAAAARSLGLRLVVLFGSRASASPPPGPDSDWDIAVCGCPRSRFADCFKALSAAIDYGELDLVRLEDADCLFRHEIMRVAVLLHGDPDLFCEMRTRAWREFEDSTDLFALEQALFRKKMDLLRMRLDDSR